MENLSRAISLSLFFCFFAFLSQSANAQSVVINEIAWMGAKVEGIESKNWWRYEWLELYNNTGQIISLVSWKIELYRDNLDWSLGLKGQILPESYFLIVASDKIFTDYDLNYSNLGGKLNNNGQKVLLKDGFGNIIDSLDCFSYGKWFAGDKKTWQTMERRNSQILGSDPNNWKDSQNPEGTPKAKNSEQNQELTITNQEIKKSEDISLPISLEKIEYPARIIINEILPSPEGPDDLEEWIEISNQNQFEVDLSGWKIKDSTGAVTTFTVPPGTKISALGFLVIDRPTTKIVLNNDGDEISLIQPDNKIIETISYPKAPLGQSYTRALATGKEEDLSSLTSRFNSEWFWTSQPTPGANNIIPQKVSENKKTEPSEDISKENEDFLPKKELAAIGKQVTKNNYFVFLIALAIAVFSAIIILILKRKLKSNQ